MVAHLQRLHETRAWPPADPRPAPDPAADADGIRPVLLWGCLPYHLPLECPRAATRRCQSSGCRPLPLGAAPSCPSPWPRRLACGCIPRTRHAAGTSTSSLPSGGWTGRCTRRQRRCDWLCNTLPRTTDTSLLTTHHAPRTTHHAPRTTHHAPRTMHHAPRTMHHSLITARPGRRFCRPGLPDRPQLLALVPPAAGRRQGPAVKRGAREASQGARLPRGCAADRRCGAGGRVATQPGRQQQPRAAACAREVGAVPAAAQGGAVAEAHGAPHDRTCDAPGRAGGTQPDQQRVRRAVAPGGAAARASAADDSGPLEFGLG
jgi:hypothetical protein